MIAYFYDETGSPIGMAIRTRTSATTTLSAYQFTYYLFTKNLQGDIVGIYTSDGAKVAEYRYDAWGNHTVYDGNGAAVPSTATSFIGNINPFRYRGYYFDTESGFYYLNSRYYDPQVKRFISADDISYLGANGDLNSFNLYAYCSNNPVMYVDAVGNSIIAFIVTLAVCAIIGGTVGGITAHNEEKDEKDVAASIVEGAAIGLMIGGAVMATGGVAAGAIGGASVTFLGASASQIFAIGALGFNFVSIFIAPFFGIHNAPVIEYESYNN